MKAKSARQTEVAGDSGQPRDLGLYNRGLMNMQRIAIALLIAFTASFFIFSTVNTINDPVFSIDFLPYHFAGQLLAQGDLTPLTDYDQTGGFFAHSGPFLERFHHYFFPSSTYATRWVYFPAYLWIFRPLASLDFPVAARIWLIFNAFACVGSVLLLWSARHRSQPETAPRSSAFAWYLFLGLTFQPVFSNLMHGQVTGLIFFIFCLGYWLLRAQRPFAAGLAFGFITLFKFYPALLLVYFLFHRQWRVLAGAAAAGAVLVVISLATVGLEANLAYAQLIVNELAKGGMAAFNNESLTGFLLHAFTSGDVNVWQDMAMARWLTALRLVILLATLFLFVWVMRKPRRHDGFGRDLDLSLVILFMLIASPITWYHYYMWLIFPLVVIFDYLVQTPKLPRKYILWFALGYALTVVEGIYIVRPFAPQAIQHMRILRIMLSQSFFGAILLASLIWALRLRENP